MLRARVLTMALAWGLLAGGVASAQTERAPDLGDVAQGTYSGAVISDAKGSSRSDVAVTVTRSGPDTVQVASNYARLPARTFRLTRAMDTIQNVDGTEVFLMDLSKSPPALSLTIDDASWSGTKDGGAEQR